MNKKIIAKITSLFLLFMVIPAKTFALSYTDVTNALTDIFWLFSSGNAGETSFRSLLIPVGGRPESLGNAYTGLCDDAAYINYNAAASCVQKETQLSIFHNSWIADSKMETLSYTTRFGNLGLGAQLNCFYVPFTEYNIFGERVAGNYYSETTAAVNAAYNFLAGYNFKGFALGVTAKTSWRGVPDYTDDDSGAIIPFSGISQSSLAVMMDLGLLLQFNIWKKLFYSRDPNVKIGFSAQNIGLAFTGLGSGNGISIDDPLPTYISAGMSVKFLPLLTVTGDIKQPINLQKPGDYDIFSFSAGAILDFTKNFTLLAGLEVKGGNPKISAGGEFEIENARLNFNYTLDLTSSVNPINRISLSAKVMLGDRGRAKIQKQIDYLYNQGLEHYYRFEWEEAIEQWEQVLAINKRYDPAILGIKSAQAQIDMNRYLRESMTLGD